MMAVFLLFSLTLFFTCRLEEAIFIKNSTFSQQSCIQNPKSCDGSFEAPFNDLNSAIEFLKLRTDKVPKASFILLSDIVFDENHQDMIIPTKLFAEMKEYKIEIISFDNVIHRLNMNDLMRIMIPESLSIINTHIILESSNESKGEGDLFVFNQQSASSLFLNNSILEINDSQSFITLFKYWFEASFNLIIISTNIQMKRSALKALVDYEGAGQNVDPGVKGVFLVHDLLVYIIELKREENTFLINLDNVHAEIKYLKTTTFNSFFNIIQNNNVSIFNWRFLDTSIDNLEFYNIICLGERNHLFFSEFSIDFIFKNGIYIPNTNDLFRFMLVNTGNLVFISDLIIKECVWSFTQLGLVILLFEINEFNSVYLNNIQFYGNFFFSPGYYFKLISAENSNDIFINLFALKDDYFLSDIDKNFNKEQGLFIGIDNNRFNISNSFITNITLRTNTVIFNFYSSNSVYISFLELNNLETDGAESSILIAESRNYLFCENVLFNFIKSKERDFLFKESNLIKLITVNHIFETSRLRGKRINLLSNNVIFIKNLNITMIQAKNYDESSYFYADSYNSITIDNFLGFESSLIIFHLNTNNSLSLSEGLHSLINVFLRFEMKNSILIFKCFIYSVTKFIEQVDIESSSDIELFIFDTEVSNLFIFGGQVYGNIILMNNVTFLQCIQFEENSYQVLNIFSKNFLYLKVSFGILENIKIALIEVMNTLFQVENSGSVTFDNVTIVDSKGKYQDQGSLIYFTGGNKLLIRLLNIESFENINTLVYCSDSNQVIINNTKVSNIKGLFLNFDNIITFLVFNCTFEKLTLALHYNSCSKKCYFLVINSTFQNNVAAIEIYSYLEALFANSTFKTSQTYHLMISYNNIIYLVNTVLGYLGDKVFDDAFILRSDYLGNVQLKSNNRIIIQGCLFREAKGYRGAGMLAANNNIIEISQSIFQLIGSWDLGALVFTNDNQVSVYNCFFIDNYLKKLNSADIAFLGVGNKIIINNTIFQAMGLAPWGSLKINDNSIISYCKFIFENGDEESHITAFISFDTIKYATTQLLNNFFIVLFSGSGNPLITVNSKNNLMAYDNIFYLLNSGEAVPITIMLVEGGSNTIYFNNVRILVYKAPIIKTLFLINSEKSIFAVGQFNFYQGGEFEFIDTNCTSCLFRINNFYHKTPSYSIDNLITKFLFKFCGKDIDIYFYNIYINSGQYENMVALQCKFNHFLIEKGQFNLILSQFFVISTIEQENSTRVLIKDVSFIKNLFFVHFNLTNVLLAEFKNVSVNVDGITALSVMESKNIIITNLSIKQNTYKSDHGEYAIVYNVGGSIRAIDCKILIYWSGIRHPNIDLTVLELQEGDLVINNCNIFIFSRLTNWRVFSQLLKNFDHKLIIFNSTFLIFTNKRGPLGIVSSENSLFISIINNKFKLYRSLSKLKLASGVDSESPGGGVLNFTLDTIEKKSLLFNNTFVGFSALYEGFFHFKNNLFRNLTISIFAIDFKNNRVSNLDYVTTSEFDLFLFPIFCSSLDIAEYSKNLEITNIVSKKLADDCWAYVVALDAFGNFRPISSDKDKIEYKNLSAEIELIFLKKNEAFCLSNITNLNNYFLQKKISLTLPLTLFVENVKFLNNKLKNFTLNLSMRSCIEGESYSFNEHTCYECELGFRSVLLSSENSEFTLEPPYVCDRCLEKEPFYCYGKDKLTPKKGFARFSTYSMNFLPCPNRDACAGDQYFSDPDYQDYKFWTSEVGTGLCENGYQGILCSECEANYGITKAFNCDLCEGKYFYISIFFKFVLRSLILFTSIGTALSFNYQLEQKKQIHNYIPKMNFYLKILINHFQVLIMIYSLPFNIPYRLKQLVFTFLSASAPDIGNTLSFECLVKSFDISLNYQYVKVVSVIGFNIVTMLGFLFYEYKKMKKKYNTNEFLKNKTVSIFLLINMITIIDQLKPIMELWACVEVGDPERGISSVRMISQLKILCHDYSHFVWSVLLGIPVFIFIALFNPLWLILQLIKAKNENKLYFNEAISKYGYLYYGYNPERFYYEFIVLIRKLSLLLVQVFYFSYPGGSTYFTNTNACLILLFLLFLFLVFYKYLEPYNPLFFRTVDICDTWSFLVLIITVFVGVFWTTRADDLSMIEVFLFLVLVFVSNIIFFIFWGFHFWKCIKIEIALVLRQFVSLFRGKASIKVKPLSHINTGSILMISSKRMAGFIRRSNVFRKLMTDKILTILGIRSAKKKIPTKVITNRKSQNLKQSKGNSQISETLLEVIISLQRKEINILNGRIKLLEEETKILRSNLDELQEQGLIQERKGGPLEQYPPNQISNTENELSSNLITDSLDVMTLNRTSIIKVALKKKELIKDELVKIKQDHSLKVAQEFCVYSYKEQDPELRKKKIIIYMKPISDLKMTEYFVPILISRPNGNQLIEHIKIDIKNCFETNLIWSEEVRKWEDILRKSHTELIKKNIPDISSLKQFIKECGIPINWKEYPGEGVKEPKKGGVEINLDLDNLKIVFIFEKIDIFYTLRFFYQNKYNLLVKFWLKKVKDMFE